MALALNGYICKRAIIKRLRAFGTYNETFSADLKFRACTTGIGFKRNDIYSEASICQDRFVIL